MKPAKNFLFLAMLLIISVALAACSNAGAGGSNGGGGGGGNGGFGPFTIGGTVSGLAGTGLTLQNNGADSLFLPRPTLQYRPAPSPMAAVKRLQT
jgi:6-phosphogluconolactonase